VWIASVNDQADRVTVMKPLADCVQIFTTNSFRRRR
jgi:hypothetical protein